MRLLVEAAREVPEIMTDPAPLARFKGFGDSSLDFRLLAWVKTIDSRIAGAERAAHGHPGQARQCWNSQVRGVKSPPCYDWTTVESGQWRSDFLAACTTGTGRQRQFADFAAS